MTLPEIYERISSLPSGGYLTVDTRFNKGYVYSLIHSARAFIVAERWKTYGKIPPIYYQYYTPEYKLLSQDADSCYVKFYNVPDIIALDGRASGLGYVGADGSLCQFREVSSRAAFASMLNNRIIAKKRKPMVLIDSSGEVEVYYKDRIEDFEMAAIYADPTSIPTYNIDYDSYPMDITDIPKMEQYLVQGVMGIVYKTPIDRVNEQRDTSVAPAPKL